ncbi:hypothetical protein ABT299_27550 [Spirillospora sp. NPDC000708]
MTSPLNVPPVFADVPPDDPDDPEDPDDPDDPEDPDEEPPAVPGALLCGADEDTPVTSL